MTILSILYLLSKSLTFLHSLAQSLSPLAQRANEVHQSSEIRLGSAPVPGQVSCGSGSTLANLPREGGEPVNQVLHFRNLLGNVGGGLVICLGQLLELLPTARQ
ncbi:MAG: hypothetical protein GW802_34370, partial [Armatimonadetes bacterium]|nr:hypothetical protein [Armatimonadota bacterium]